MIKYIKLGKVRGLTLEISNDLGLKPFFRKNKFHYEVIIDIPYSQIIFTSGSWVPKRSTTNVNKETNEATECAFRTNKD